MDYIKKLFSYDRWANNEYLRVLASASQPDERAIRLMAHVVAAQMLWMDRIRKRDVRAPVWPEWNLDATRTRYEASAAEWKQFVEQLNAESAGVSLAYKNSKGEPWESRVEDIAIHVANHGTYHRAQIAALLRAAGMTPPYTDYIEGVRRGKVTAE